MQNVVMHVGYVGLCLLVVAAVVYLSDIIEAVGKYIATIRWAIRHAGARIKGV